MKKTVRLGVYAALCFSLCVLALRSGDACDGARAGLQTAFTLVVPSLFPFFVLSSLFVSSGLCGALGKRLDQPFSRLFRLPGSLVCVFLLGLVCGFPVGARLAAQVYEAGLCTKEEAERAASFCSAPGLGFVVGTVGVGVFQNAAVGWMLWVSLTVSGVLIGVVSGLFSTRNSAFIPSERCLSSPRPLPGVAVTDAVKQSTLSVLCVAAYVVLFSALNGILEGFGVFSFVGNVFGTSLLKGALEMTNGVTALSGVMVRPLSVACAGAVLGWSGLSVLMQIASVTVPSGLSVRRVFVCKAVQAVLSSAFCAIFSSLL